MRKIVIAILLGGAVACPVQSADSLYQRQINEKNPGGKDLVMTAEEKRRDDRTSTIKVTRVSGASVPSSMFMMRAFYDIAEARGVKYFIKLQEWESEDGGWMYLVGFSQDANVAPQEYFGLDQPLPATGGYKFLAVEEFDLVFKKEE